MTPLDAALVDYNQAIRLNPNSSMEFNDRGNIWMDKNDFDRAIADYDQAIQLDTNYAKAYYNRGVARFNNREWVVASEDFARMHEFDSKDAYAVLWQALAGIHQQGSGWAQRLAADALGLSQDWPMPMVRLYEGQITGDQMLAEAGDTTAQPERRCEVEFYLGEWKLAHGQAQEGAAYLKNAQSTCPHFYAEYETAVVELKRLGGK